MGFNAPPMLTSAIDRWASSRERGKGFRLPRAPDNFGKANPGFRKSGHSATISTEDVSLGQQGNTGGERATRECERFDRLRGNDVSPMKHVK